MDLFQNEIDVNLLIEKNDQQSLEKSFDEIEKTFGEKFDHAVRCFSRSLYRDNDKSANKTDFCEESFLFGIDSLEYPNPLDPASIFTTSLFNTSNNIF